MIGFAISWVLVGVGVAFWFWWQSDKEREKPGDLLMLVLCGWISLAVLVVEWAKECVWWRGLSTWRVPTRRGLGKKSHE